jgi:hypothetical protein
VVSEPTEKKVVQLGKNLSTFGMTGSPLMQEAPMAMHAMSVNEMIVASRWVALAK